MRVLLTLLAGLLLLPSAVSADVVELKTGQKVEGTFKQATAAGVTIEVGGQVITFEQEKVRAIYFGSAPALPQQPNSPLSEALRALKGLQSVTTGGVNYREYSPRVLDAKVVVDRFLDDPAAKESAARDPIRLAIDFYVIAERAWNGRVVPAGASSIASFEAAGGHPSLQSCPKAMTAAETLASKSRVGRLSENYSIGSALAFVGLPLLWECASDRISEAERARQGGEGK